MYRRLTCSHPTGSSFISLDRWRGDRIAAQTWFTRARGCTRMRRSLGRRSPGCQVHGSSWSIHLFTRPANVQIYRGLAAPLRAATPSSDINCPMQHIPEAAPSSSQSRPRARVSFLSRRRHSVTSRFTETYSLLGRLTNYCDSRTSTRHWTCLRHRSVALRADICWTRPHHSGTPCSHSENTSSSTCLTS